MRITMMDPVFGHIPAPVRGDALNVTYALASENATMPHVNAAIAASVEGADLNEQYQDFYEKAQFVTGLICYPILCIIGLTGNILTLIVLSRKKMITSTNVFLSALAVADTIKLLNDALYFLVLILNMRHPTAGNRMMGYMYPVSHYIFNAAVCVTAWLTVSVAVERYIAVCHATKAKEMCTVDRARIVSVVVFIAMSMSALPSAFRYTKVTVHNNDTNESYYDIGLSKLGQNQQFMTVYSWIQNLLRAVIPLVVLFILNMCIIHALRKQRVKGKKMSARNRITLMLLSVIFVFLICITPDAIMSTFFGFGYVDEDNLVKGIREFTDMLLAVNSAVNFVVYCAFSKIFRDTFMEIFCESCRDQTREENHSLLTCASEKRRDTPSCRKPIANGDRIMATQGPQTFV